MNWLTVSFRNMVASEGEAYFKVLDEEYQQSSKTQIRS